MKPFLRAFIAVAILTGIAIAPGIAQDAPAVPSAPANQAPPIVAPPAEPAATNLAKPPPVKTTAKPAVKTAPKKVAAKPEPKSEPVLNPEPGVAKQNNVNVRGQASINSEVITHLQKNQPITLLEEITLRNAKQDEPARWFRIALPTNMGVWVHSSFVDSETKTVKPRRLNLRGGPGENYSVLGRLEKGAVINQLDAKEGWLKIEPPTNAFGFVAAHLVERAPAPPAVVTTTPPPPPPVPTAPPPAVTEVTPPTPDVAATDPEVPPPVTPPPPATTPPPVAVTPAPAETLPDTPIEKVKKIVSREGILRGSVSIQAPSHFELRSLDTGKTINYIFSPTTNLMLKEFKGKRILVSGEELLDERWQNTPVIIVDSFEVVP